MIKWFCDVCSLEIVAPENPTNVRAYRCGKNRSDAAVGWGEDDDIMSLFCHSKCANVLEGEIKGAVDRAKRAVKNNA